ncbi:MAG: HD domain-containing protein [Prosthecobacter sp.]|nr:HD domain-containing protein [Prosthecobacter sp.]
MSNQSPQELFEVVQSGGVDPDLKKKAAKVVEDKELPPIHQEFFLPIHGFVKFYEEELLVINHPAFQRLGLINQLGLTYFVYRGATHKRMEHALGVTHIADQICASINENHGQLKAKKTDMQNACGLGAPISNNERRFIRLAALVHDIGHLPSGHTLEDEICLVEKHDARKRLKLVLEKKNWHSQNQDESLADIINLHFAKFLDVKKKEDITATELLIKVIGKGEKHTTPTVAGLRLSVCMDIVANTICADLLDYLYRDWHHIGKPMQAESRILQYFQIRKDACDADKEKVVVSLGHRDRPKRDSISAILGLLEARYNLFEAVIFHPTKCAACAMLERAIMEIWHAAEKAGEEDNWSCSLEESLLSVSDEQVISIFIDHAKQFKAPVAELLLTNLSQRNLFKSIAVHSRHELKPDNRQLLLGRYLEAQRCEEAASPDEEISFAREAARRRFKAVKMFEEDLELDDGSVVMYCPPANMSAKIQKVKILQGQAIHTLEKWDAEVEGLGQIAGGHCAAQIRRFADLWRLEIFVSPQLKTRANDSPSFAKAFRKMIGCFLIGDRGKTDSLENEINDAITNYQKYLPVGCVRTDKLPIAANNAPQVKQYPMGAYSWKGISHTNG